jgi:hypothetical protein
MSIGRKLLLVFRWGIFLLACVFLYTRTIGPKGIVAVADLSSGSILSWPMLGVVCTLMLVNWGVEAYKWRMLLAPVEPVSMWRAFRATIAGTSVGLVTFNRTGEFLGRVLFLAPEHRVSGAFATALGSIAQFVVTLVLGGMGLLGLILVDLPVPWPAGWISWMLATLTALVTTVTLVLYLYPGILRQLLLLLPFLHRLERASVVLGHYQRSELLAILSLSAVRYAVFGTQFILLLHGTAAGPSVVTMALAIPLIYLIATLIPSIMLTELGVRGSVAVAVLGPMGGGDVAVLLATTMLWSINVAAPACAGSVILLLARIRMKSDRP